MSFERVASLLPLLPLLAVPAWSLWRLGRGLRAGDWRRPGWFGHAAWASFLLLVLAWLLGALSGGLDLEETCRFQHHEPYDDTYYRAHRDDYFRLFPLSRKCHAGYDLVAAWVNPTVAVLLLLLVASLAGLGWASVRRRTRPMNEKGPTS
ncbi:hypothetical protein [Actinoplanes teichomyceticus]|uniref:Uncharacterized protein n=1 Tax=Actinoplanes teichomyceticus TaxID=1867 RepID=A0A561VIF6_ACTTI|nr:hypothetical protein [Actinoplanes teichomyceticus]TWG11367.1 hypothetical protein FHX34_10697 [Actinoplanes teichomyceticus]GIF15818.1 hypothetical protein Ate01nite_58500 [Actinoplanes teichomyceticus]